MSARLVLVLVWCAVSAGAAGGSHIRTRVCAHTLGGCARPGGAREHVADSARPDLGGLSALLRLRGGGLWAGLRREVPRGGGILWGAQKKEEEPGAQGPSQTRDEAYYTQGDSRYEPVPACVDVWTHASACVHERMCACGSACACAPALFGRVHVGLRVGADSCPADSPSRHARHHPPTAPIHTHAPRAPLTGTYGHRWIGGSIDQRARESA
jgi:hypothetical protein